MTVTAVLQIILILVGLVVLYLLFKKELDRHLNQRALQAKDEALATAQTASSLFQELRREFFEVFQATQQELGRKLEEAKIATAKTEELLRSFETYASDLRLLKETLARPKSRGQLGEIILKEILTTLPSRYWQEQYPLGADRVDYVLKLNDRIIPIDSKFPLEKFLQITTAAGAEQTSLKRELVRNLKEKIESIARKYIMPQRGTIDFALMYLANEAIYYELLTDPDYQAVWDTARAKSVLITSPRTFEQFCSSLALVVQKAEVAANIQVILSNLAQLDKDLEILSERFATAHKQLSDSYRNLTDIAHLIHRFADDFKRLITSEIQLTDNSVRHLQLEQENKVF